MEPENFRYGGGLQETLLHPLVFVTLIAALLLMFCLRRNYALIPALMMIMLTPFGQQLVLGGMHIFVTRIVIMAGWIRVLSSREISPPISGRRLDKLDKIFLVWAGYHVLASILLYGMSEVLVNQIGFLWDMAGGFFLMRFFIQDDEDIQRILKAYVILAAVVAAGMLIEHFIRINLFGFLGGVPSTPELRGGMPRAQGPFAHPLRAGTWGATLIPLFLLLWARQCRWASAVGIVAATIIVATAGSSTPLLAYAAAILGVMLWPLRKHMRTIRLAVVGALMVLNIVMKAPVWFLIGHVAVVDNSSASHRAHLIDEFIMNFFDWWLVGTAHNANWGWYMYDLCNQYVEEGVRGGLVAFVCFLALICVCFSRIGTARKRAEDKPIVECSFWLLGVALFTHVIGFFGISYIDQARYEWLVLLTIIIVATNSTMETKQLAKPVESVFAKNQLSKIFPWQRQQLHRTNSIIFRD